MQLYQYNKMDLISHYKKQKRANAPDYFFVGAIIATIIATFIINHIAYMLYIIRYA